LARALSKPTSARSQIPARVVGGMALSLCARPWLWLSAKRVVLSYAPRGWWHRPPFLPLPDRAWFAFRMETAYGDPCAFPSRNDLIDYLAWHRSQRRFHKMPIRAR
jgi:hypothetical protein